MENPIESVDRVIRQRRTVKVFADDPVAEGLDRHMVEELVATAGWAPFHFPAARVHLKANALNALEPWRFYLLDNAACRNLRQILLEEGDRTKIPKMLAAASAMILATWLPHPSNTGNTELFEPTQINMEHIAATSAAIQNLLLAATARGIKTYWSSGGRLRKPEQMERLGIPPAEILLGSVFLWTDHIADLPTATGKMRQKRGPISKWSKWVEVQTQ